MSIMEKNTRACLALWRGEVTLEDLAKMSVRSAFIVMMRSNLLGEIWSYVELGKWFGISRSRVEQVEQKELAHACWKRHGRATRSDQERFKRLRQG